MIYVIVGGSFSGKTSFTVNTFIDGKPFTEYKDLLPYTVVGKTALIGKFDTDSRRKGTDTIARKHVKFVREQVDRIYGKYTDIVLEGTKMISHPLINSLIERGYPITLIWLDMSLKKCLERNRANESRLSEARLKAEITRSKNLYYDYIDVIPCEAYDSDAVTDFSTFRRCGTKINAEPKRSDFAVFILSHGRAENVITWATLHRCGYTGKRYIVIDNEDDQADEYRRRYGESVLIFDKREIEKTFDTFDNRDERRTVVFARNACFELARQVGVKYFLELDDDYTDFHYRFVRNGHLMGIRLTDLDGLFDRMIEFLETSGALTVALSQGGDFVGGVNNSRIGKELLRKAMNSFFCSVDRPFQFLGRINEDVNTYTLLGSRGHLFFSVVRAMLTQNRTQSTSGGMTGCYIDSGTYVKTFYTVLCMPSAVKVQILQANHRRIHHMVYWNNCVPEILSERWRK